MSETKNEVKEPEKQEVAKNDPNEIVAGVMSRSDLSVLKNTLSSSGVTDQEFNLFVKTAASANLNPFLNHIYCIKYGNKMNIQISVEGIQHLARQKEGFLGYDSQVVCENDEFEAGMEEGKWQIKKHNIKFPRGKVAGAYAVAKRKGFDDVIILMDRSEIEKLENSTNIWKQFMADMFRKHVLKRALRQQFGIELDDSFDASMGDQGAEAQLNQSYERKDISQEPQGKQIQTDKGSVSEEEAKGEIIGRIMKKQNEIGMNDDQLTAFSIEKFSKKPEELNAQQLTGLEKILGYWEPEEEPEDNEPETDPEQVDDEDFFKDGLV
jgi:recombination protein RecT